MLRTIIKYIGWTILCFISIMIGTGMAILVTKAIDYTRQTACFDYKTPEACEEVNR